MEDQALDCEFIRTRRQQLGLTESALGELTGTSTTTISGLQRGTNHENLRLRFLSRLAAALGVLPSDLFRTTNAVPGQAPMLDDVRLEALLYAHHRIAHRASVARALGMTMDQLTDAEEHLAARLAGSGVWLQRHWGLAIHDRTGLVTASERAALAQAETARTGINLGQAAVLRDVILGRVDGYWLRQASVDKRVRLGAITHLGWAKPSGRGYAPTAATRATFQPALRALRRAKLL
jgi:transcriptional regulator with XRE-family HTH domain